MNNLGQKFIQFILRHSLLVIIITFLITLGAISLIPRIKFDNSVDAFFDKKSKSYIDFQKWKEQFGSDEIVVVAFSDDNIFTQRNLNLVSELTQRFEALQYVDKVTSLTNVNNILGSENDFIVRRLIEEKPSGQVELRALRQSALQNPLYLKNLISEDGKTTAIVVELERKPKADDVYKKEVILNIKRILKEEFPKDKKYYISGFAGIEHYFAAYMQQDLKTFLPIMLAIVVIVLIFSFRSFVGFLLPMLVVLLSLCWSMAFLYLCGFSINNVTTVIPPIMLSITLLESIHFVWELIHRKGKTEQVYDANGLIVQTMQHLFIPCFLTNVTTVIGFFSLLVTRVPPIRQLGWVSGIGVFFAFILTFTFLPALIKQFNLLDYLSVKQLESTLKNKFDAFLMGLTKFSDKFKMPVLLVTVLAIGLAVWQTTKIKTETSVLEYFHKNSPIYKDTRFIEENLSGTHFLNVSLKKKEVDYFKDPAVLKKLEKLEGFLKSIPEVDKTTSVVDYLKEINKSFHNENPNYYAIPESRNLIAQYLLLYGAEDLEDFVNPDWNWTTVRIRLKEHSTVRLKKVIDKIQDYLDKNLGQVLESNLVGQTILEVDSNEAVTSGQVNSLSLAMLLIFGMMFIDFRSIKLGLLSIIPNAFPLLLNFGMMGLLGIRLDSATSMISDIGIGIIVDDTIHFYHSYAELVRQTGDYQDAMYRSFAIKGSPTIITTIILIVGFGVVAFSKFMPTFYFGVLSAILIFNGLLSELLLSPALLMLFKPKFKK